MYKLYPKAYNKYSTEVCTVINDTDTESNIAGTGTNGILRFGKC